MTRRTCETCIQLRNVQPSRDTTCVACCARYLANRSTPQIEKMIICTILRKAIHRVDAYQSMNNMTPVKITQAKRIMPNQK